MRVHTIVKCLCTTHILTPALTLPLINQYTQEIHSINIKPSTHLNKTQGSQLHWVIQKQFSCCSATHHVKCIKQRSDGRTTKGWIHTCQGLYPAWAGHRNKRTFISIAQVVNLKPPQNIFVNIKINFLHSVVISPRKGRSLVEKLIECSGSRSMLAKLVIVAQICKS